MSRIVLVLSLLLIVAGCRESIDEPPTTASRIVSLTPAVTETLFALGAQDRLVGRSDFDRIPEAAQALPAVGTSITPNYEAIARLNPDLILADGGLSVPRDALGGIAPTVILEWLSKGEVLASVHRLAGLVGAAEEGERLVQKLRRGLEPTATADAPTVLVLIGLDGLPGGQLWYLGPGTLHGDAILAAGLRNVVEDPSPTPQLSVEGLLALDPDWIVVVQPGFAELNDDQRRQVLAPLARLTMLRAVREQRVRLLVGSRFLSPGPSILAFVEQLRVVAR